MREGLLPARAETPSGTGRSRLEPARRDTPASSSRTAALKRRLRQGRRLLAGLLLPLYLVEQKRPPQAKAKLN